MACGFGGGPARVAGLAASGPRRRGVVGRLVGIELAVAALGRAPPGERKLELEAFVCREGGGSLGVEGW